jgi:hypothetical protein
MKYTEFTLKDFEIYLGYLSKCEQMISNEAAVASYCYCDRLEINYSHGFAWRFGICGRDIMTFPPVGDWNVPNWRDILADDFPEGASFFSVPERLLHYWQEQIPELITYEDDADYFDYVCDIRELVEAKGNKYSRIRNERNKFFNSYDYSVTPLNPADGDRLLAMQEKHLAYFREHHAQDANSVENMEIDTNALKKAVSEPYAFKGLMGLIAQVQGNDAGFITCERMSESYCVGVFSKFSRDYPGLNQIMQYEMGKYLLERGIQYLNIEGDDGIESLRQAKQALRPCKLEKQYLVNYNKK